MVPVTLVTIVFVHSKIEIYFRKFKKHNFHIDNICKFKFFDDADDDDDDDDELLFRGY